MLVDGPSAGLLPNLGALQHGQAHLHTTEPGDLVGNHARDLVFDSVHQRRKGIDPGRMPMDVATSHQPCLR